MLSSGHQVSDEMTLSKADEDDIKVKAMEFYLPLRQRVWLKITEVNPDPSGRGMRVHGSMKLVSQVDGSDLDPTGRLAAAAAATTGHASDQPPELFSIHRATVKRIEAYGMFVELAGYRRYGLVHSSQVANYLEFSREDSDETKKAEMAQVTESCWRYGGQGIFACIARVAAGVNEINCRHGGRMTSQFKIS